MLLRAILASAICCCSGNATAQSDALVIENARVIIGDGTVKEGVCVTIRGGRIESVQETSSRVESTTTIDARGMTVLPGLIDTHVHILWPSQAVDGGHGEKAFRQDFAWDLPGRLQEDLRHGVTTVKSTGEMATLILELRGLLADGKLVGPRILVVGPVFTAPGGHPAGTIFKDDPWARSEHCVEVDNPAQAREQIQRVAAKGVDAIKLVYQAVAPANANCPGADAQAGKLRKDVMQAIIEESHRLNLRATVHTGHEADAIEVVQAGADGVEHGVADAVLATDRLADVLRARNAFYVPTLRIMDHVGDPQAPTFAKQNLKHLVDKGVRVAVGTDTQGGWEKTPPGLNTIQEMELMVEAGLTTEQVIRAGTRDAAEHLGLLEKLGTVEAGKIADLIIVAGDPLKDISALRQIRFVIQSGHIVHSPSGE
jgi:imidazolonepropionase-like amidohydrolase